MSKPRIDELLLYLDSVYQHSPVRNRSKTVGAWLIERTEGGFHFSLTRRKGHVYLSDVWAPTNRRDRHIGGTGMAVICALLDAYEVGCVLDVRGFDGGMGTRRLKKWYTKYGFIAFHKDGVRMGRVPKCST